MKIELTKEQYKTLLKIMYCGEWMINSYKLKKDKAYEETENLEQHLFSYAKEFGLENWFNYEEKQGSALYTYDKEQSFHKLVDKYNLQQKKLI